MGADSGSGTGSVLNRPFLGSASGSGSAAGRLLGFLGSGSAYGSLSGSPSGSGSGEEPSALSEHGPTSFSAVPKYFRCKSSLKMIYFEQSEGGMNCPRDVITNIFPTYIHR